MTGPGDYERLCARYFNEEENKPYSICEVCAAMGISLETLEGWEAGGDAPLRELARRVKQQVAAGWEKGAVSPSLAVYLHKRYLPAEGGEAPEPAALDISLRVVSDDGA